MDEVRLRGHHIKEIWKYIDMRDERVTHQEIAGSKLEWERKLELFCQRNGLDISWMSYGEDFERHQYEIFCGIYEHQVRSVTLITNVGDLCLEPRRNSENIWCRRREEVCSTPFYKDALFIRELGLLRNFPISVEDFVRRIRSASLDEIYPEKLGPY